MQPFLMSESTDQPCDYLGCACAALTNGVVKEKLRQLCRLAAASLAHDDRHRVRSNMGNESSATWRGDGVIEKITTRLSEHTIR